MTHRTLILAALTATLALPGVAQAGAKPTSADRAAAKQECRTERGTTDATRDAFAAKYGTNKNQRNAFGKCVSQTAKAVATDDASATERKRAVKECAQERGTSAGSLKAFADKHGTNAGKRHAFGNCVAKATRA